ncbi:MAG: Gfo/Idh/MocA family protein [Bacteroidota bacterium]|jgi:predicted dehydrogenase
MEKPLSIGLVGAGHLGKIHLKQLQDIPLFSLVGFYDENPEIVASVSKETGLHAFSSFDELLAASTCVDIVVPTVHHFALASRAMKAGKHVFIEKPLTATVDEAKALLLLAKEASVKVQVGHVERYNPAFVSALPYLHSPRFIEIHRLAQFNPRGTDVSVVLDLMIHDIDIILSVIKSPVKNIHASGVSVVSDTPDIANARIEFHDGCVANLTASRISMKNMRKTRFFQRDAYIAVDFLKRKSEIIRMENLEGDPGDFDMVIELGAKGRKRIVFEMPEVHEGNAIRDELSAFANAIAENKATEVGIEDGVKAMEIAFQIIEKLEALIV